MTRFVVAFSLNTETFQAAVSNWMPIGLCLCEGVPHCFDFVVRCNDLRLLL